MPSRREIAVACRCQLLTGSYVGSTRSCKCSMGAFCALSKDLRLQLIDHPTIVMARTRNKEEFQRLEETN